MNEATGTNRGDPIVAAMVGYLREHYILLPSPWELERLALAARSLARKRAHRNLVEGLSPQTIAGLEALLIVAKDGERTPLAWLREWPEAPRQGNLVEVVERLEAVRKLGVGVDREKRIHRARYAAIARESAIVSAQHLSRFDTARRLATLAVFAREMEAILTDAALAMFHKMLGSVFRPADRAYKDNVVDRAKTLDASARAFLSMAKAMLAAKERGEDQIARFSFHPVANASVFPAGNDFPHPKARGHQMITITIAQTIPQPIHVMLGCAACQSRICLWMAIRNPPASL